MSGDEIIIELVSIARREPKEAYFEEYDHLLEEVTIKSTRKFQPSVEEANKALETLVKWAGLDKPNNDLQRELMQAQVDKIRHEIQSDDSQEDKLNEFMSLLGDRIDNDE